MSTIFWDTNLFIYLIEQTPDFSDRVIAIRKKMIENKDLLVTSTLTLGEVLVRPLEVNRADLVAIYKGILRSPEIILIQLDELVAENYAKIRALYPQKIKPPDAIQLACASAYGIDTFITNDNRLNNLHIDNVKKILALNEITI